jgi:ribulose-phosphate 3-epimerase
VRTPPTRLIQIAPSILSANFAALGKEVAAVARGGADLIHVDVMDGHFVPNLTMGAIVVDALKRASSPPLDVHLMIEAPDRFIASFARAGAAMISVHMEATPHLHRALDLIKQLKVKAGVVLNPATPASALEEIAADVDFVVVMSVNPGLSGQPFIHASLAKIARVRAVLDAAGNTAPIEIDGGVDATNVEAAVRAGASIIVAGSAIFGQDNPEAATRDLRRRARRAAAGAPA